MYTETIRLNKNCEVCGNFNYGEDDSGFYVCQTCGTISDIRFGAELEFETKKGGFIKLKSKNGRKSSNPNMDEDIEEKSIDNDSDKETNVYTNINTRNNSEINDFSNASSRGRRKSNKIIPAQKTLKEALLDSQRIFLKILGLLTFNKGGVTSSNKDTDLLEYAKNIWFNYINNEYDIQTRQNTLFGKCRKSNMKYARSRSNTIDDINNCCPTQVQIQARDTLSIRNTSKKIKHLNEQLKSRRIKADNIMKLYKEKKSLINKKKFIEEYDEVLNFLNFKETRLVLMDNGIEINYNTISYVDLLRVCKVLKISYAINQSSFEELIHLIFVDQAMHYQTTQTFNYDIKKSTLNGDYYLALLYQIINLSSINQETIVSLSKDLLSSYKKFNYIKYLNLNELKMFKYSNFDKYTQLLNAFDRKDPYLVSRASNIIKAITKNCLHMPEKYEYICIGLLQKIQYKVLKIMGNRYLIEDICIAICFYAIKVVYGLNDLPYLSLLQKNKECFTHNSNIAKGISVFEQNTSNDTIGQFYNVFPSILTIIESFSVELYKESDSQIITMNQSLKDNLSKEYKEKYSKCIYEQLYSSIQNIFSAKNIKALENKVQKNALNSNQHSNVIIMKTVEIKKSNKFLAKKNKHNQIKQLSPFLEEEIAYHKDNTNMNLTIGDIEYPFPCDTFIHHNRQANKFEMFKIPTTEVLFLYFFSKYFKLDYNSLKVLIKSVERAIDNLIK